MEKIAIRFKDIRISKSLTQQSFADLLGTKRNSIAQIESGNTLPTSIIIASAIVKGGVSPAYLFYGIGPVHNEEWDTLLNRGKIEREVLNKLQNIKETQFYKTIFSALSTSISIQVFLCLFFKKIDSIDIAPEGAKQKLIDLLVNFEKEYKNFEALPSNARYLSKKDRQEAIDFIVTNFDDDEAYFMLKNAKKIQAEIRKEIPHINKLFNC